jgi:hypothetical protein
MIPGVTSGQTVPAPWRNADIGGPTLPGTALVLGGTFTVTAGGADIWDTSDQFHFVYQPITGNAEIVARVASITRAHAWSKAGVMIRESLAADSRHATVFASAGKGYAFQRRVEPGGLSASTAGPSSAPPGWVRLVRTGNLFEAYQSANGVTWTRIGSETIAMGETVYTGLPVTSHNVLLPTTTSFANVSVTATPQPPNQPPAVSITSPATGTQYTAPATVNIAGSASDPEGRLLSVDFYVDSTMISRDTTAPFAASWSASAAGTYSLTAIAHDADGGSTTSAAVRITVGANGAPTVSLTSPANGAAFTAPATINLAANASDPEGQLTRVEFFNGTSLLGSDATAPYAFSWSNVAAGSYTLTATAIDAAGNRTTSAAVTVTVSGANGVPTVSLTGPANNATFPAPATIALAASASDPEGPVARVEFFSGTSLLGSDTTAPYTFSWANVPAGSYTLTAAAIDGAGHRATSAGVTISVLPSGQQNRDIGSPAMAGSVSYANGTYTIRAAGTDIWNGSDQFHFVYQQMTGDAELTARVTSIANAHAWSKAGVMARATLAANSAHATMFASFSRGFAFQRRQMTGGSSVSTAGSAGTPPGWIRLVRTGDLFEAFESRDGATWIPVGSETIVMPGTVYVGLAVTSHNTSSTTTAAIDSFTVAGPPANQPPTVSLTSPANGATFTAPATIDLAASASDPENQLTRVEFYNGTTVLGSDTTAPYAFSWTNVAAGTYTLTAAAIDAGGARATSAAATVTVSAPTSTPPRQVVFTASSDHATNVTSYRLDVFTSTADPATATPVATANLGKPAPNGSNDITSDQSTLFANLAAGNYVATVTAVGPGGATRSASVAFSR